MQSIIKFLPANWCERASEIMSDLGYMGGIENHYGQIVVSPEKCVIAAREFRKAQVAGDYFNNIIKKPAFSYEEQDAIFVAVS